MRVCQEVSVIVPVYNRAALLERALKSVVTQSRRPHEIIVVDDGSEDDVAAVARRIEETYEGKCIVVPMKHSGKPGKARNVGIAQARGGIIAFLDSDDIWEKRKLEMQIPRMHTHLLCHTRERWIRGGKHLSQASHKHRREGYVFSDAVKKCIIGPSTVIMDKVVFEKYGVFREDLRFAEDYELWLRITAGERVAYVDIPLVSKCDGEDDLQLSKAFPYVERWRIDALESLLRENVFPPEARTIARAELERKKKIWNRGMEKRRYVQKES